MPEIAIKQTLNDKQFRTGLAESAVNVRNWGREAAAMFESTRTPAEKYEQELARINKLHRDGYIDAETMARGIDQLAAKTAKGLGGIAIPKAPGIAAPGAAAGLGGAGGMQIEQILQQLSAAGGGFAQAAVAAVFNPLVGGAAALAGATAGFYRMAMAMEDSADSAARLGVSLQRFEEMRVVAQKAGVLVEEMTTGMQRFQRVAADAAISGGKANETLRSLGLDASKLATENVDEAYIEVAKAIANVENKFARTRIEMELFGRGGGALDAALLEAAKGFGDVSVATEGSNKALADWGQMFEDTSLKVQANMKNMVGGTLGLFDNTMAWASYGAGRAAKAMGFTAEDFGIEPPQNADEGVPEDVKKSRLRGDLNAEKIRAMMATVASIGVGPKDDIEKVWDIIQKLETMGDRGKAAIPEAEAMLANLIKGREREAASKEEAKIAADAESKMRQADAAADSWHKRLQAATNDADTLAATLIQGSAEFAGNFGKALDFIRKVKDVEAENKMLTTAEAFDKSLRAELDAKPGESRREAQLRNLVESGLNQRSANRMAQSVAELDAGEQLKKLESRWRAFAPSADQGSREAYNILHQPSGMKPEEKQAKLQELTNTKLVDISRWLQKIFDGQAKPAAAP